MMITIGNILVRQRTNTPLEGGKKQSQSQVPTRSIDRVVKREMYRQLHFTVLPDAILTVNDPQTYFQTKSLIRIETPMIIHTIRGQRQMDCHLRPISTP